MSQLPFILWRADETYAAQWRPPVALGHPHVAKEDLEYKGIQIPKGAYLHLNAWAIHHDEKRHKDPGSFVPERYEGDERSVSPACETYDAF